ncbi:hypothetical protein DPMN_131135 [Dreissena polymorpha]|uniref:Uncharacterized protein n=1 Tax=Dreissena polymorpha TaxID=45954 RepID=A0A9D4JZ19_DREPO|nr:hypothetical protein DPMN_131135 [Dreissena polymorpha]
MSAPLQVPPQHVQEGERLLNPPPAEIVKRQHLLHLQRNGSPKVGESLRYAYKNVISIDIFK